MALCVLLAAGASVAPIVRERRHVRPAAVLPLLVPTLLCVPLFVWLVGDLDTRWLALCGGGAVTLGVGLLAAGLRSRWFRRPEAAVVTGASSALLNVVGGVGGPPIGLYGANADWGAQQTRANLHTFFLVQNTATALALGLVLPSPGMLAALVVGTSAGLWLAPRFSVAAVRRVLLTASLIGGLGLVVGAV